MEQRDFFISYTNQDESWAVWIANALISHGYTAYAQKLDIMPGDNFIEKMNEFLKNSGNFIAVWSKGYSESRFCMTELRAAFNMWHKKQMDCFLFVRIDNHPLEPLYAALVYVDLHDKGPASEKMIMDAVRNAVSRTDIKQDYISKPKSKKADTGFSKALSWVKSLWLKVVACLLLIVLISATLIKKPTSDELFQRGENYYYGANGVEKDYVKARNYYEQAAEKGNARAMNSLGWLYRKGLGVEQDYVKAMEYYEQAAAGGNDGALNSLGYFYHNGLLGVERDYIKARYYYELAAEKGSSSAMYHLGQLYKNGQGVEVNNAIAQEYFQKAAQAGDKEAIAEIQNQAIG